MPSERGILRSVVMWPLRLSFAVIRRLLENVRRVAVHQRPEPVRSDGSRSTEGTAVRSVGRTSLADLAYEELLDAIVERRLPPGTRLLPTSLASGLGVSPTPVKLALARLASDGLVRIVARRGMFVSQFDTAQLDALFEARLFLEVGAARDYFDRVTPEFIADLERVAGQYRRLVEEGGDHLRWQLGDLDRSFHRMIVALTGNDHILRWYEQANIHIQGHRGVTPTERYQATLREHEAIIEAFRYGDPQTAVTALSEHLQRAKAHLLRMLETAGTTPAVLRLRSTSSAIDRASEEAQGGRPAYSKI